MPRTILVSTLVVAAFGVGFGARSLGPWTHPASPETPKNVLGSSPALSGDEKLGAVEASLGDVSRPASAAPAPTKLAPSSPTAAAAPTTPPALPAPSTGMSQLAYAPILPDVPDPFPPPVAKPSEQAALPPIAPPPVVPTPAPQPPVAPPKLTAFPQADIDAMREMIAQMRKGEVAGVDAAIKKMTDPVARTLAEWTLIRGGGKLAPYTRILSFLEKEPDWPTQPLLQRRAEEALAFEAKPTPVVRAFFANRKPLSASGKIVLARALLADKQRDEAFALIRSVWREETISDETEGRLAAEFADGLRREDHRARMERFIFKDEMGKALRSAQRIGADFVALVKAREAVENKTANAKALLEAVPKPLRADSSYMFARAQFARRGDRAADAVKEMEGVSRDPAVLVDGDEWWAERRMIARKLLDAGDAKLAYKAAAEHGASSDAMRVEAEFHAGWIALRYLRDAKLAQTHFDKAADAARMPMSVSRTAYWQGRAAEARGDAPAAQAFYRKAAAFNGFFYGQLARAKLPADADSNLVTGAINASPTEKFDTANDRALRAIDLLLTLNERDFAISFVFDLAVRSGSQPQLEALGDMLTARGDARAVLMMGKLALQRGVAIDRHAFPTFGIPTYQALTDNVEPSIVLAIARQESAFDPRVVSHAGARGLMQLMPATARVTATRYNTPFDVGRLTSDAPYNAQIGSAHLGDLLNDWRGSYILVFAAYNAGSHNVKKWIDANGDPRNPDVDPIDWIERIPYNETRNYVQRVMENLEAYRSRLMPGTPLLIEADMKRGAPGAPVAPIRNATIAGDPPAAARASR
ncbi:lytic transglycosylase domain-containing protein [Terrarubrum flagellatum]|uniref:lytic transglycosylase domain-containing protein n=1 Tax=Terrirubrum flagellatum TaxID=2895980 RepID=UPI003145043E